MRTQEARGARLGLLTLAGVLAAGLGLRLWLAFTDDGLYWPDEIYQSLEVAHHLVWGYGLIPWEFEQGARSWALPGLVAGLMWLTEALGFTSPEAYLGLVRAVFCLAGVGTAWGAWHLARRLGASPLGAAAGAGLFALAAPALYFAPRAMSETASALPVVWGLALALPASASRRARLGGAALLALAVLLRLHNGVFCAVLLLALLGRAVQQARAARREGRPLPGGLWRPGLEVAGVLALGALAYGLLDALTWGRWFHSFLVYWRFNVVEGKASNWGVSPWHYYLRVLWRCAPLPTLCVLLFGTGGARRAPALALAAVAFLALHSVVPHKELRFILPALPLFAALVGLGVDVAARALPARWALAPVAGVLLAGLVSAAGVRRLTFRDVGAYEGSRGHLSAFDDSGPVNRLLLAAHRQQDLCGLKVEAVHLAWTGGHSYLHRRVPLYPHNGPPRTSGLFNYVITRAAPRGATVVAQEGGVSLVRLPRAGCVADPGYAWRLP